MKKLLNFLLITILFIPVMVNAAECDTSKVYIDSISIDKDKTKGNVIELENATAKDKKVNLNLRMATLDDEILYKVVLKNDSSEDYEINKNSISLNSDYLEYSLESDNNNIIKANSTRTIYLRVKYKTEVDQSKFVDGVYQDNVTMKVNLRTDDTPANPNTGVKYIIIISLILLISGLSLVIFKKKKLSTLMILVGLILLPVGVKALCTCEIVVDSKVTIRKEDKVVVKEENACYSSINTNEYSFVIGTTASTLFGSEISNDNYKVTFLPKDYFNCIEALEEPQIENYQAEDEYYDDYEAYENSKIECLNTYSTLVKSDDKIKSKYEGSYLVEYVGLCDDIVG